MKTPQAYKATAEGGSDKETWILVNAAPLEDRLGDIRTLCRTVLASTSQGTVFGLAWDILRIADPEMQAGLPTMADPDAARQNNVTPSAGFNAKASNVVHLSQAEPVTEPELPAQRVQ